MGFIYKITNIKTNKCYIGETKEANPETRWKQHLRTIAKEIKQRVALFGNQILRIYYTGGGIRTHEGFPARA